MFSRVLLSSVQRFHVPNMFRMLSNSPAISATSTNAARKVFKELSSTGNNMGKKPAEKMKEKLTFKEFKQEHVESFEQFRQSSAIQATCGNNVEKATRAYNAFCRSQYALHQSINYGGNPSLLT